jgi:tetratricopeptide (TPR) repeat protein
MLRHPARLLRWALLLGAVLASPAALRPVAAEQGPLGEEWEELILDGMRQQDSRLKEASLDALVREQELLAARPVVGAKRVARLYLLARAYGKRMDPARKDAANARQVYAEVLSLAPICYFAHRDLGLLALAEKDVKGAEASLMRALAANASYVQALRDLARLCQEQGRHADAVVHLKRVIDLEPTDPYARPFLVQSLLALQRFDEARRDVQALLKLDPKSSAFRDLDAELELAAGNLDRAASIWKQLQHENPSAAKPLYGQWRVLDARTKRGEQPSKEELLTVVNRLVLLERDPARRKGLQDTAIALSATPRDPNLPPDDATLLKALDSNDEKVRGQVLMYLAFREQKPTAQLLRGALGRLGPVREPAPSVRAAVLMLLGSHGGVGTLPIARLSLDDPDARVRAVAVQCLEQLAELSEPARRAATLILALHADAPDRALAGAARSAVLRLTQTVLDEASDGLGDSEAADVARLKAWWASPPGNDVKIRALGSYAEVRDLRADEILVPYLSDPDFFVVTAAYRALQAAGDTVPDGERKAWLARLPTFLPAELEPANRDAVARALTAWLGSRPR